MRLTTSIVAVVASSLANLFDLAATAATAANTPAQCCASLEALLAPVTFSASNQQDLYQKSIASYFSVQDRLNPTCIFAPKTTQDVSTAVALLRKGSCQFAIRSGGHGLVVGANNIRDGVTMDLSSMKSVKLSQDNTTAAVQPGARWIDVYKALDAVGYAIPGGRAGDVGVGGLTTGGGNSFFAARYGLVCDNVKNFEVVLGSGQIVNANNKTNPDLFQALKGGSNNLGIVTRFDIVAFPQGPIWGGTAIYNVTKREQLLPHLKAFNEFTDGIYKDPYGSLILLWFYSVATKSFVVENLYEYTKDVANPAVFPPAFVNFSQTSAIGPPIANTLRVASLANLTGELNSPPDVRNYYATITFKNDINILHQVLSILENQLYQSLKKPVYTFASVQFQPLPRLFVEHGIERGGNILGLDRYQKNSVLCLLDLSWTDPKLDSAVAKVTNDAISALSRYLRSVGALREFQYLNYADSAQDPIGGYGPANVAKLKAASKKYDPDQVFQKLVPGGFKLADAGKKTPL